MKYLNEEAAYQYLSISRFSLAVGIIGYETFLARVDSLCQMIPPNIQLRTHLLGLLRSEDWLEPTAWPNEEFLENSSINNQSRAKFRKWNNTDAQILLFIPSIPILNKWEFHKGDPDPNPSIPHGHHHEMNHKKLDVYQGRVYYKGQELKRVPRDTIIELWNLKKFREFAREAIEHFLRQNITWSGWKVQNPRRLPKLR